MVQLTRCEANGSKTKAEANAMFPFDLYLDLYLEKKDGCSILYSDQSKNENKIWFFKHINKILDEHMQQKEYGCKIDNVCVSIGSKIQLDTFYNAELLFHNYGNVYRFAYLIAKDIFKEYIDEEEQKKKIILIAYEAYSSMLVQYIADILQKNTEADVQWLIFSSETDEEYSKTRELWPEFNEFLVENIEDINECVAYIVLPVATTLTTIFKIQNIANRICARRSNINPMHGNHGNENGEGERIVSPKLSFGKNHAIIVVGAEEVVEGEQGNIYQGIRYGYWEKIEIGNKTITIKAIDDEIKKSSVTRYYFAPASKWNEEIQNGKNYENRCIIGVDKTSTLPDAIFEQIGSNRKIFGSCNKKSENAKLDAFEECITYAHICDEENHYQYDIDYSTYYQKITGKDSCKNSFFKDWLQEKVYTSIDKSAYNIIVSPLTAENTRFVKAVIEHAFEGNVRLFNIQINSCYKEDIRTKFSYVAEEYKKIKKMEGIAKINIYYVDNCIVSGRSLQRGKQLMHMFFEGESIEFNNVKLYKGVILLANRSSYETIYNILPGHVEDFFHLFV